MSKLGLPTDILPTPLCTAKKGDRKAKERQDPLPKECSACNFLKPPKTKDCPICHHVAEAHSSLEEEDGELVQIDGKKQIGRANVYTQGTNAQPVCTLLIVKKQT